MNDAAPPGWVPPVRLDRVDALATPAGLGRVVGPVAAVSRARLTTAGKSAAVLERLDLRLRSGAAARLVLKRNRPAEDWVAAGSGDRAGREAALLGEAALGGVWHVFRSPYLAYAAEDGAYGLLMEDVSADLLPADQPLDEAAEDAVLSALAALHARYWNAEALRTVPWLASPAERFALLCPASARAPRAVPLPADLAGWVVRGWAAALTLLPGRVRDLLTRPAEVLARSCEGLPWTLLHGDTRLVNFARGPDGAVAAFDWALSGLGPAGLDLGWYLIGNPARHARPKDAVLARYRALLERALAAALPEALWERTVEVATLLGAASLLWDRALDLEDDAPWAREEWAWWVDRLTALAGSA